MAVFVDLRNSVQSSLHLRGPTGDKCDVIGKGGGLECLLETFVASVEV